MIFLFIFLDIVSFLFGISAAILLGERFGDEFSPNILALTVGFFLVRSLLYWILFNSVIKRDISWIRNIFQSVFLIVFLSMASFLLTAVPTYLIPEGSDIANSLLFITDVQGLVFYFAVAPIILLALSFILHRLYKLEPW